MYGALLLTSLVITLTNGESRLITSNYKAVNFAREIRRRRLNGNVIEEIDVDSEGSCQLQCVEESSCLCYNFASGENNMFKCQLSDSDRFTALSNFTEDPEVLYRGIKVIYLNLQLFYVIPGRISYLTLETRQMPLYCVK